MTAQGKITAAKLNSDTRILVHRTDTVGQVGVALRKTGDDIVAATVTAVEPVKHGRTMGRRITTDAGVVTVSASQTFMIAPTTPKVTKPAPAKKAAKVPPAKGTARPPAPGKPARMGHSECYAAGAHSRDFKGRESCRRARREAATIS